MHVQHDVVLAVDLRRDVERDPREEGLQGDRRRGYVARPGGGGRRADVGDVELVGADLEHRLLAIDAGNARARQHLNVALRFEEVEQSGKVGALESQAEEARAELVAAAAPAPGKTPIPGPITPPVLVLAELALPPVLRLTPGCMAPTEKRLSPPPK